MSSKVVDAMVIPAAPLNYAEQHDETEAHPSGEQMSAFDQSEESEQCGRAPAPGLVFCTQLYEQAEPSEEDRVVMEKVIDRRNQTDDAREP